MKNETILFKCEVIGRFVVSQNPIKTKEVVLLSRQSHKTNILSLCHSMGVGNKTSYAVFVDLTGLYYTKKQYLHASPENQLYLHPQFVEIMMGFPEGWTELKPWEIP